MGPTSSSSVWALVHLYLLTPRAGFNALPQIPAPGSSFPYSSLGVSSGDPNTNLQSPISLTLFHFLCSRVTVTSWSSYLCITSLIPYKSLLKWTMQRTEEHNRMGKSRDLFKKFWVTKGTFNAKMDTIKDRKCVDLTEEEYIKKRWQEYT